MENVCLGTELKINLSIGQLGDVHMSDIDFTAQFYVYANHVQEVRKADMLKVDDDNYLALLDSSKMGTGKLKVKVTAFVPDTDFKDRLRTEVVCADTGITLVG